MKSLFERHASHRRAQERAQTERTFISNNESNLLENVKIHQHLNRLRSIWGATKIQSVARRKLAQTELSYRRTEYLASTSLQKWARGARDRKRARETKWKKLAVAPTPYSLKLMRIRSKELETIGNWTEMFDPNTNSFWYLNKVETYSDGGEGEGKSRAYTCWEAPPEFEDSLICFWDFPLLPSGAKSCSDINDDDYCNHSASSCSLSNISNKQCCRRFDNRNEFNYHRMHEHSWFCSACETKNTSLTYPECFACGNSLGPDGEDLHEKLEKDVSEMLHRLRKQEKGNFSKENEKLEDVTVEIDSIASLSGDLRGSKEENVKTPGYCLKNNVSKCPQDTENPSIHFSANPPVHGALEDIPVQYFDMAKEENILGPPKYDIEECKSSMSSNPRQCLFVCQRFKQGICTRTTCPRAHPGIRDHADEYKVKDRRQQFYVMVCFEALSTGKCHDGQQCRKYHPYIRPSTEQIIRSIYPKRNGPRRKIFENGTTLDGQVVDEIFEGHGVIHWPSGNTYIGMFHMGQRHGPGIWRSYDGKEYCGMWEYGLRSGWGIWTHGNGEKYEGQWKDGKFHGLGKLESSNGDSYEGQFVNGKYDGISVFRKKDGSCFVGYSKGGLAVGMGVLMLASGEKYVGQWKENLRDGKGSCIYPNQTKYIGQWKKGKHNGYGIFTTLTGARPEKYIGYWKENQKEGDGLYQFKNGDEYHGTFMDNQACGTGTYFYFDNKQHFYHGQWRDDMKHGHGTYSFGNGSKYEGSWQKNYIHGKGKLTLSSGSTYSGQFRESKKHGKGVYMWSNGNCYEGEFDLDVISGQGTMKYASGHFYTGQWKDNKKNGVGKFHYNDGTLYFGHFVNDKKQGKGKLVLSPGTILEESYDGDWLEDKRHGRGIYTYRNDEGSVYIGSWRAGLRHGKGCLILEDGSKYEGDFDNEKQTGKGVFVYNDKEKYTGDFIDGERHGWGTLVEGDGTIYEGGFRHDLKHGKGKIKYVDGSTFIGSWENGQTGGEGQYTMNQRRESIRLRTFGF